MALLRAVNGVRLGREGRERRGGPDNNVTIRPAPRTSRAVEESESKQWPVAEGVSGRGEGRGKGVCWGEVGRRWRRGGQSSRVPTQAVVRRGPKFVCVCVRAGRLQRGKEVTR